MFQPQNFLTFAICLNTAKEKNSEVYVRTCIGRAYYAAFLVARDKASMRHRDSSTIHSDVIKYYAAKKKAGIVNRLKDLKQLRQKADYVLDIELTAKDSRKAVGISKEIIKELEENKK
jgi:uncharacterized protein (UPF0332 family)